MKLQLPHLAYCRQWNSVDLFLKPCYTILFLFLKSHVFVTGDKKLIKFRTRRFCPTWRKNYSPSHVSGWTIFFFFFLLESADFLYKQFWTVTDMDALVRHWSQIHRNLLKLIAALPKYMFTWTTHWLQLHRPVYLAHSTKSEASVGKMKIKWLSRQYALSVFSLEKKCDVL